MGRPPACSTRCAARVPADGPIAHVAKPQRLVLWSRLGPYDTAELDRLLWQERKLFEYDVFLFPSRTSRVQRARMLRRRRGGKLKWDSGSATSCGKRALPPPRARAARAKRAAALSRPRAGPDAEGRATPLAGDRQVRLMLDILAAGVRSPSPAARGTHGSGSAERVFPPPRRSRGARPSARSRSGGGGRSACGRSAGLVRAPEAGDAPVPERVTLLSPFDRLIDDRSRAERCGASSTGWRCTSRRRSGSTATRALSSRRPARWAAWTPRTTAVRVSSSRRRVVGGGCARRRAARRRAGRPRRLRRRGARGAAGRVASARGLRDTRHPRRPGARSRNRRAETPIYQTSTYAQDAVGEHRLRVPRVANPTRKALQECLASLEGAEHGVAFSSGLARPRRSCTSSTRASASSPSNDVYGGTYRMFSQVYEPKGYRFTSRGDRFDDRGLADELDETHPARVARDADEPHAQRRRPPRRGRGRARRRRARRRRQHVRDAVPAAAARARRRRRAALDDEVPRRALGRRRRLRSPRTTTGSPSGCASCRSRSARCPARSTAGSCCAA